MPAAVDNVEITQGDELPHAYTLQDGTPLANTDLTDAVATWRLAVDYSTAALIELVSGTDAELVLDEGSSTITRRLLTATTAGLEARTYVHQLQIVYGNGDSETLLGGTYRVNPRVLAPAP